jgi:hypothetical protein
MSYSDIRLRCQSQMLRATRWIFQPSCPLPLPEALRSESVLRRLPRECPKVEACCLNSTGLPPSAALFYPLPSRVWDRATDIRSTCVSRVSAVSRPTYLSCGFRPKRTASLPGHLDCTTDFRLSSIAVGLSPVVRHDSRRAVQNDWTCASMPSALD